MRAPALRRSRFEEGGASIVWVKSPWRSAQLAARIAALLRGLQAVENEEDLSQAEAFEAGMDAAEAGIRVALTGLLHAIDVHSEAALDAFAPTDPPGPEDLLFGKQLVFYRRLRNGPNFPQYIQLQARDLSMSIGQALRWVEQFVEQGFLTSSNWAKGFPSEERPPEDTVKRELQGILRKRSV